MTPLAMRIVKEQTLPLAARRYDDRIGLIPRMDDIHCFEVSDILPLAEELDAGFSANGYDARLTFLPAPRTWIEGRFEAGYLKGRRIGMLLEQRDDRVTVAIASEYSAGSEGMPRDYTIHLGDGSQKSRRQIVLAGAEAGWGGDLPILALLTIINLPRLVGRKQHLPHSGLQKRLSKAKGVTGRYPLHAWTELKLSAAEALREADARVHEARLSGEKCHHFCRSHLRVKSGRVELVRAHWRGNPALGIKRTRYNITP